MMLDRNIKKYADTLYDGSQQESSKTVRDDLREAAQARAARTSPIVNLPLNGPDVGRLFVIMNDHIERCITMRFESYRTAYEESGVVPSEQDFAIILQECHGLRKHLISQADQNIRRLIQQYGGARGRVPARSTLEASSAHANDRIVSKWKQWKAKIQLLKPGPITSKARDRQKDIKFPVFNVAEFNIDVASLAQTASHVRPLSVIVIDVDDFKSVNDELGGGHVGGDRCLMALSELLLKVCESKGTAYRWGGDEFCVLLENHSLEEAQAVAERIRRGVRSIKIDGLPKGFSTSIGVASYPESSESHSKLFEIADKAMYQSKEGGRNRVSVAGKPSAENEPEGLDAKKAPKEEIKKQLAAFLKEARMIQDGIAFNNSTSVYEKQRWETRVEGYLAHSLDDTYVVQFQIPSREVNELPHGIVRDMMRPWRELTARMWMLSDFISKLRD